MSTKNIQDCNKELNNLKKSTKSKVLNIEQSDLSEELFNVFFNHKAVIIKAKIQKVFLLKDSRIPLPNQF